MTHITARQKLTKARKHVASGRLDVRVFPKGHTLDVWTGGGTNERHARAFLLIY
jgi:hypothetical protein